MPYYNICPHCGGNIDPGEKCDCQIEQEILTTVKGGKKNGSNYTNGRTGNRETDLRRKAG